MNKMLAILLPLLMIVGMCSCDPKDDAEDALDAARRLAAEGKFEEALEKHVWFHNHALEVKQSYYGVRLSFALADWAALGKQYPKALVVLRGIRDEKTERLLAGEYQHELFHDVESINENLEEPKATVALFKKLESSQPDFAASVYDIADEALIDSGEYGLAKKYLGDPKDKYAEAKQGFDKGMESAKRSRNQETLTIAYEHIFTQKVIRIITVCDKAGAPGVAREIQSKALEVLASPGIKDALKK